MEDNRKFELNDDALDEVAGGAGSGGVQSVTYNGMTWTVGQPVKLPYCSANTFDCPSYGEGRATAVITGFFGVLESRIKSGTVTVYLLMDCCKKETQQPIKNLKPYTPTTTSNFGFTY